jgi:ribonuclease BN (tRNA processing enzyme)
MASDAGRIAADAAVKHLVINHLIPADDPEVREADWIAAVRKTWSGRLTIGRDGHVVTISGKAA